MNKQKFSDIVRSILNSDMNHLPLSHHLPISNLAQVFSNTSASYKFYWFLGILDIIAQSKTEEIIPFHKIIIRMMALSWYTINFHKLSFGIQDKLARAIKKIIVESQGEIAEDASKDDIIQYLEENYLRYKKDIDFFNDKVPYHFLSPFVGSQKNKASYVQEAMVSYGSESPAPYKLSKEKKVIILHPDWTLYLKRHIGILRDFTLWNFTNKFLQPKNPNIPNITEKLVERPIRKSLATQTQLWKLLAQEQSIISIYSQEPLHEFDLDHYVPWSFVSHNQLWNLAPIEKAVNSSKSNKLPPQILIPRFTSQQYDFFQCVYQKRYLEYGRETKILEDYSTVFNHQTRDIASFPKERFQEILSNQIEPLIQFASNLGFQRWDYSN